MLGAAILVVAVSLGCGETQPPPTEPAKPQQGTQPDTAQPEQGASAPTGTEPTPGATQEPPGAAPTTPDQCRAAGGQFVASPGGEVTCPEGTEQIATIRFGIEGGVCCK